jgi:hypothetical protein
MLFIPNMKCYKWITKETKLMGVTLLRSEGDYQRGIPPGRDLSAFIKKDPHGIAWVFEKVCITPKCFTNT